jgi:hypothetical protein
MISVFNTLPVIGAVQAVSFNTTITRATTTTAETLNECIWMLQAGGY